MRHRVKFTDEQLRDVVAKSQSVADTMRNLGYRHLTGGSHAHLSRRIKAAGIDTAHFISPVAALHANRRTGKLLPVDILRRRDSGKRQHAYKLRRALIESGVEYRCGECGIIPEWNGKELRFEVDHRNNDNLDDRIENLRFLCPNCHSQRGHSMNHGKTGVTSTRYERKRSKCPSCGKSTWKAVKACSGCRGRQPRVIGVSRRPEKKACPHCGEKMDWRSKICAGCREYKTKIQWPDLSVLLEAKANRKMLSLSRSLGVSDNAVQKRIARLQREEAAA